jgi:putative transposase
MKRARFTEEQIIGVLRESEAGVKTADVARKHGVSEATLYNWKGLCCKTDVGDSRRESSGVDGRDAQTCRTCVSHDKLA